MRVNERREVADHQRNAAPDTRPIVPAGIELSIDVQSPAATVLIDWAVAEEAHLP